MRASTCVGLDVLVEPQKMGLEGIVSKRKNSTYRSGRSLDWLKMKNPACEAVRREAEEDFGQVSPRELPKLRQHSVSTAA